MNNIINDHKTEGGWKIQITMEIQFFTSEDSNETRTMYTRSDDIEIMMGNEKDEIIEELFESLLKKYQKGLEESIKGSEFVFDSVDLL